MTIRNVNLSCVSVHYTVYWCNTAIYIYVCVRAIPPAVLYKACPLCITVCSLPVRRPPVCAAVAAAAAAEEAVGSAVMPVE